jgi:hypothetical protein
LGMSSRPAEPDAKPAADSRDPDGASGSSSLSHVLGKVLEQLSVSAWLPAAMLVGNVAVLLQLSHDRGYGVARAVRDLAGKPIGTIVIIAFSVILATLVTQAFEFEAIRLLEGYFDSAHGSIQALMAAKIRRHEKKREKLKEKLSAADKYAREKAVARMRDYPQYDPRVLDILLTGQPDATAQDDDGIAEIADDTEWKALAPSAALYRIDSIAARLASYPQDHRLLPTRLGNVLRAAEDKVELEPGENIQGFVIRHDDRLSPAIRSEHRAYRTRLDMYCCLVLVFSALAVLSVLTLAHVRPYWGADVTAMIYVLMACVSYEAAIASARSYGLVLREISQRVTRLDDADEDGASSALSRLLAFLHRDAV